MPRDYSKPYKDVGPTNAEQRAHMSLRNGVTNAGFLADAGLGYPVAPKREQPIQRRSTCGVHGLPLPCQFCARWWQDENAMAERTEWEGQ